MNLAELQSLNNEDLYKLGKELGVFENGNMPHRREMMNKVLANLSEKNGNLKAGGILSILNDGYGFLRQSGASASNSDVYVSQSQIRRFSLRTGDEVHGQVRPPKDGERYFGLVRVEQVNGSEPDRSRRRKLFESLTAIHPTRQIALETRKDLVSTRLIDMLAPIGRGQRGLIVSPPKAGKTTLLKQIADGIAANAPDMHIMVALIGERPEEVTDVTRSVDGEVYSSTFDEPVEDHCRVAEMVLERSKRLVEGGKDVVILLDSITRLTRAYNLAVPSSGRTLSGGMGPGRALPAQAILRCGAQYRRRRLAHHHRRMPHRHGQQARRPRVRGVQGHGQHGSASRSSARRAPLLPRHRHRAQRHAPRRAAHRRGFVCSMSGCSAVSSRCRSRKATTTPSRSLPRLCATHATTRSSSPTCPV